MGALLGGQPDAVAPARPAPRAPAAPPMAVGNEPAAGGRVVNRSEHTVHAAPSTRVHAAPGGNSSMSSIFGGDAPATVTPAPTKVVPPAATAAPANLAAGQRVAVRTEHTGISEVASSRVLAAPGGQSSMASIIGGGAVEDRKAALLARRAQVGGGTAPFVETTNVLGQ